MATVPLKILGVFLLAGALPLLADAAGKAAAACPPGAVPGPGRMQVEEPSAVAEPGANTPKAWQKSHPKGLTEAQKTAFRERKEKMEGMIDLIKAKRQALREAKPEERAAIARELHVMILENAAEPPTVKSAAARVEGIPSSETELKARKQSEAQIAAQAKAQRREEQRERQAERRKERKSKDD